MSTLSYSWASKPLIVGAPMRLIAGASLAVSITRAGGLGFIGAGTDTSIVAKELEEAETLLEAEPRIHSELLPVGVGVITHAASLEPLIIALKGAKRFPVAVWLFAPEEPQDLRVWAEAIRAVSPSIQIWVQVGSVVEALESVTAITPDVLVLQGIDAGGHGLTKGASIVSLVPEVADALSQQAGRTPAIVAAGGIADGRGAAAALCLGAQGICLGTRLLATSEAVIAKGYQNEVLRAADGGQTTVRSKVYDTLRGTTHWPERIGGRGIINQSFLDWESGRLSSEENIHLYEDALTKGDGGWGPRGRLTTYAGTAVGLVNSIKPAGEVLEEVRGLCRSILKSTENLL